MFFIFSPYSSEPFRPWSPAGIDVRFPWTIQRSRWQQLFPQQRCTDLLALGCVPPKFPPVDQTCLPRRCLYLLCLQGKSITSSLTKQLSRKFWSLWAKWFAIKLKSEFRKIITNMVYLLIDREIILISYQGCSACEITSQVVISFWSTRAAWKWKTCLPAGSIPIRQYFLKWILPDYQRGVDGGNRSVITENRQWSLTQWSCICTPYMLVQYTHTVCKCVMGLRFSLLTKTEFEGRSVWIKFLIWF